MRFASSLCKVASSAVALVAFASLAGCPKTDTPPDDVADAQVTSDVAVGTDTNRTDTTSPTDVVAVDTSTVDVQPNPDTVSVDAVVTDTPITGSDSSVRDVVPSDAAVGPCEVSSAVADHVAAMATGGWSAQNASNGLLLFGCGVGQAAADCLSSYPLTTATSIGDSASRSALANSHLRLLYSSNNSSAYWTRISPDGRFIARGTHVHDMVRNVEIETAPAAAYDPAFFPDNSRFFYQPNGVTCPLTTLITGMPTSLTLNETGCIQTDVGLYEHLGASLDGGDYWATSAGAAAWDDGGHSPTHRDPPPNGGSWNSGSRTTLTLMANTGTTFAQIAEIGLATPFQGDGVLSPSSLMLMTRVADSTGANPVSYTLHSLHAVRTSSGAISATMADVGHYCFVGAKPAFSLDERWVTMHRYVTDADATELGFTSATDPGFAAYRTQGASNIYLLDLATGTRTRLTNMQPGQYALYPAFRSDGWIYFNVRTLNMSTEYVIADDAALVLQ